MMSAAVVVAVASLVVRKRVKEGGEDAGEKDGGRMNLAFSTAFLSLNSRREERYNLHCVTDGCIVVHNTVKLEILAGIWRLSPQSPDHRTYICGEEILIWRFERRPPNRQIFRPYGNYVNKR